MAGRACEGSCCSQSNVRGGVRWEAQSTWEETVNPSFGALPSRSPDCSLGAAVEASLTDGAWHVRIRRHALLVIFGVLLTQFAGHEAVEEGTESY